MQLEEIIQASVEKKLSELFGAVYNSNQFRAVVQNLEDRLATYAKEQMAQREPELRRQLCEMIQNAKVKPSNISTHISLQLP